MFKFLLPLIKKEVAVWLDGVIDRSKVLSAEVKPLLKAELHKALGVP